MKAKIHPVDRIQKSPWLTRSLVIALLFIGLLGIPKLKIDNSIAVWFVENDPALKEYQRYKTEFGNDEVMVSLITDTVPVQQISRLKQIAATTRALEKLYGIASVNSLTNIPVILQNSQAISIDSLLKQGVNQEKVNYEFKKLQNLASIDRFWSAKQNSILIYTWMDTIPEIEYLRNQLIEQVHQQIKNNLNGTVYHGGTGVIYNTINQETLKESTFFSSLSLLILLMVLFLIFRRWLFVGIYLLSIAGTFISLFGFMGLAQIKVNLSITALIPLVMIIAVAILMHIYRHFTANSSLTLNATLKIVLKPILFTTLTTAGGFLSLAFAQMKITRQYGLFAALGTLLAFIFTVSVVLLFTRMLDKNQIKKSTGNWLNNRLYGLMSWGINHKRAVLFVSTMVGLLALVFIKNIVVDTNTMSFIPDKHPTALQSKIIEHNYGAYIPMDFVIKPPTKNFRLSEFLAKLKQAQEKIDSLPYVNKSYSLANLDRDIRRLQLRQKVVIPFTSELRLKDAAKKSRLLNRAETEYRLSVFGSMCSAKELNTRAQQISEILTHTLGPKVHVAKSGYLPLYAQIIKMVLHDQLISILMAFVIIGVLIALFLKNIRYLMLALLVNALPIAMLLATMSLSGIWLDISTVTIAAAMLGIIVDDTLHILYFFNTYRLNGLSFHQAIKQMAMQSGLAIVSTTMVIVFGFGVLGFSTVSSISHTGLLIALISLFALLSDIILLPVLLFYSQNKFRIDK